MSHAPQNPVDTDVPLNNFSHCHAGILRHLDTFGELPALLAPAQRARAVAENIVKFFRAAAFEHHEEEEQELFTAVLADARPGEERERVQAMIALLTREHRDIEAQWNLLEPQLKKLAKGSRRKSMARRCAAWWSSTRRTRALKSWSFCRCRSRFWVATATTWRRWGCRCTCGISR